MFQVMAPVGWAHRASENASKSLSKTLLISFKSLGLPPELRRYRRGLPGMLLPK